MKNKIKGKKKDKSWLSKEEDNEFFLSQVSNQKKVLKKAKWKEMKVNQK